MWTVGGLEGVRRMTRSREDVIDAGDNLHMAKSWKNAMRLYFMLFYRVWCLDRVFSESISYDDCGIIFTEFFFIFKLSTLNCYVV